MKKIISTLIIIAALSLANTTFAQDFKGNFSLNFGAKFIKFDLPNNDTITTYGIEGNFETPIKKLKYGAITTELSFGYFLGKDDIGGAYDVSVNDVYSDIGIGYGISQSGFTFSAGILGSFDYITFDAGEDNEATFGAGVYAKAGIALSNNFMLSITAKYTKHSSDLIESSASVSGGIGFSF